MKSIIVLIGLMITAASYAETKNIIICNGDFPASSCHLIGGE